MKYINISEVRECMRKELNEVEARHASMDKVISGLLDIEDLLDDEQFDALLRKGMEQNKVMWSAYEESQRLKQVEWERKQNLIDPYNCPVKKNTKYYKNKEV